MEENRDLLDRHEKFIAFILLGAALFSLSVMVYIKPPSGIADNGAALSILNTIVGALVLAFGGAANSLFKISSSEKTAIGQAAASAIQAGPPLQTEVTNTASEPVPTTTSDTPDKGSPEKPVPPMFQEGVNG